MENTITIGGRTFSFGTMPATKAVRVEVAIARVIGEPLFKAFMDRKEAGADQAAMLQAAGAAIGLLTSKMNPDELVETMVAVFEHVSCDGKRVQMDSTFTGKNKEVWQVFIAALRFNFSDFFTGDLSGFLQTGAEAK